MIRLLIAFLMALVVSTSLVGVAAAAPKEGKSHQSLTIDCDGGPGEIEVITGENAATGFGPGGEVFVAKGFAFEQSITITTFDGEVFGPFEDSFSDPPKGKGLESRLIECTFPNEFTESFVLDEGAAEFFGIPAEYIGTEVTFEGTGSGTVWIIDPGK